MIGQRRKFHLLESLKSLLHHSVNTSFPLNYLYKGEETLTITFNSLRPVMTLWQGVNHCENQKIHQESWHLLKSDYYWP